MYSSALTQAQTVRSAPPLFWLGPCQDKLPLRIGVHCPFTRYQLFPSRQQRIPTVTKTPTRGAHTYYFVYSNVRKEIYNRYTYIKTINDMVATNVPISLLTTDQCWKMPRSERQVVLIALLSGFPRLANNLSPLILCMWQTADFLHETNEN